MSLHWKQLQAYEWVMAWWNLLITWWAWTGKSYLIEKIKETSENIIVTASTWIAAVNIWWTTIHSFLWLWIGDKPAWTIVNNLMRFNKKKHKAILKASTIIIDEVSMLPWSMLDLIEEVLSRIRGSEYWMFWWMQMILAWDFLQLPPVRKKDAPLDMLYNSVIYKTAGFKEIVLDKVYRQQDDIMIDMLNNIRQWVLTDKHLELLNSKTNSKKDWLEPIKIVTHNYQADQINREALSKIKAEPKKYIMRWKGFPKYIDSLKKNCIAQEILILKEWAQVMMLKNTYQDLWIVNWSMWIIKRFEQWENSKWHYPVVEFANWEVLKITSAVWETKEICEEDKWKAEYTWTIDNNSDEKVAAKILQVPLRLAYAITVHKCQSMTLDKIECDLTHAFEDWQIYVALSRAKTLDWLYVKWINRDKLKVNQDVLNFYKLINNNENTTTIQTTN